MCLPDAGVRNAVERMRRGRRGEQNERPRVLGVEPPNECSRETRKSPEVKAVFEGDTANDELRLRGPDAKPDDACDAGGDCPPEAGPDDEKETPPEEGR